jgi:glycosyltransferase involved in cell wall biosynthesis
VRRVLMISPHFPPDTSAGTHRVRLLAPHLPAFGWTATVVTVAPDAYEGRLDPDLAALVPDTLRVVRAPAWRAATARRFGFGDLGLRALTGLRATCERLLAWERFNALFITMYPTYPAVLGPRIKARHGLPFVLDYQDPWVGAWGRDVGGGANGAPDLRSRLTRAVAARLEPRVVRRADALTAVSARTYEDVLARVPLAAPRTCAAIPVGYEPADLEGLRRSPRPNRYFDAGDGLVHVCYAGTLLPKGIPVLRQVLSALRTIQQTSPALYGRLRLHFLGTSNGRDPSAPPRVLPIARELGVEDVVHEVAPRLDYLDALNVQVQASAVLLMGSTEPHYTPSKVFPAILSRRPIIAVFHEASSALELLRRPSACASVSTFADEASLAAGGPRLVRAFEDLACGRVAPAGGAMPEEMHAWSAEALAGRLAGVLDAVVS